MTAAAFGSRIVTGWLLTMLLPSGAILAGAQPVVELPAPATVRSQDASAMAPLPVAASDDDPWMYESFVQYQPAGTYPLKPTVGARPKGRETKSKLALPDAQVPEPVQNLRRADGS